ncbi:MAG: hypothetical protein QXP88_00560 [Thermoproteota archaeon]
MPKEYEHCKESYLKKGKSEKEAEAICAGMYYNRHHITVNEAHSRGIKGMKSKQKTIYVARTKEALKGYLDLYNLDPNEYIIIPIQDNVRKNEKIKSLAPKVEDKDYKYMMVNKCIVEITTDAKLVLKPEKLDENPANKQNTDNEPEIESAKEAVKDGKLKSMHSKEEPTLETIMEKAKEGSLGEKEKEMLCFALEVAKHLGKLSEEEYQDLDKMVKEGEVDTTRLEQVFSGGAEMPEATPMDTAPMGEVMLKDEEVMGVPTLPETEPELLPEEKTMTAGSAGAEALEKEDMEPKEEEKDEEDEEKEKEMKKLLKTFNSLDDEIPVFMEKQSAIKFLREYQNRTKSRAVLLPAGSKYQRIYGNKAKFIVEVE